MVGVRNPAKAWGGNHGPPGAVSRDQRRYLGTALHSRSGAERALGRLALDDPERLRSAAESLAPQERTAILARYALREERKPGEVPRRETYSRVAEELGISAQTVRFSQTKAELELYASLGLPDPGA